MHEVQDLQDGGSAQMDTNQGGIESHVRFMENEGESIEFRFFVLGELSSVAVSKG